MTDIPKTCRVDAEVEANAITSKTEKDTGAQSSVIEQDPSLANSKAFASLSRLRKNLVYTVISVALAVDTLNIWGLFVAIDTVASEIGLAEGGNAVWVISAYAMSFGAFIPLGGRLCDVLPAQLCFIGGFAGMSCLSLGLSFSEFEKRYVLGTDCCTDNP
jgi:hypothetical protein